jgi:four helix bundle protein
MTIHKFEDLEIWKNARDLCKKIREIVNTTALQKEFSTKDQILSSSGSVMDNIAEGFERDGNKEFIQFLYISKGSLGETRSQVHRCFDSKFITELKYNELINDCLNLSGQIANLITYLHKSEIQGLKKKSL